jgi:hypothetical protein
MVRSEQTPVSLLSLEVLAALAAATNFPTPCPPCPDRLIFVTTGCHILPYTDQPRGCSPVGNLLHPTDRTQTQLHEAARP